MENLALVQTAYPHIVSTLDIAGGKPRLLNRRIFVGQFVKSPKRNLTNCVTCVPHDFSLYSTMPIIIEDETTYHI